MFHSLFLHFENVFLQYYLYSLTNCIYCHITVQTNKTEIEYNRNSRNKISKKKKKEVKTR